MSVSLNKTFAETLKTSLSTSERVTLKNPLANRARFGILGNLNFCSHVLEVVLMYRASPNTQRQPDRDTGCLQQIRIIQWMDMDLLKRRQTSVNTNMIADIS